MKQKIKQFQEQIAQVNDNPHSSSNNDEKLILDEIDFLKS